MARGDGVLGQQGKGQCVSGFCVAGCVAGCGKVLCVSRIINMVNMVINMTQCVFHFHIIIQREKHCLQLRSDFIQCNWQSHYVVLLEWCQQDVLYHVA